MMKMLMLASAAAMVAASPVSAQPHGKNHAKVKASKPAAAKASARVGKSKAVSRVLVDRNRNRIDDRDEALARKYGSQLCPPGLWKKTPSCVPPGQAKRMFREGQRVSDNYRYYTPYADIPLVLRNQYNLDDDYRYIYRDNTIYVVDPTTRLIRDIINAVL